MAIVSRTMDGKKFYSWIKYRAIVRARVSQTSHKADTRLRENVITDLINWTYGDVEQNGSHFLGLPAVTPSYPGVDPI